MVYQNIFYKRFTSDIRIREFRNCLCALTEFFLFREWGSGAYEPNRAYGLIIKR